MSFPAIVESENGHFVAALIGRPEMRVERTTRDEAIAALSKKIRLSIEAGEIVPIEIAKAGAAAIAGKGATDPTHAQIVEDIYETRAQERQDWIEQLEGEGEGEQGTA